MKLLILNKKLIYYGFIAADGCVNFSNYTLKIGISEKDVDILRKIKMEMKSDHKITYTESKEVTFKGKSCIASPMSIFAVSNKHLIMSLKDLGIDNKKTTSLSFPQFSQEFYLPFIRGYFDGDGSLTKYKSNDGYERYSCNICGTESFLLSLKEYLELNYNCKFNSKLYKRFDTETCCYTLTMTGKSNCLHFLNLLYSDSSIHLDRKYNKYLSFIE